MAKCAQTLINTRNKYRQCLAKKCLPTKVKNERKVFPWFLVGVASGITLTVVTIVIIKTASGSVFGRKPAILAFRGNF